MIGSELRKRIFSNQVNVRCQIGDTEIKWWLNRFGTKVRHKPKGICASLSAGSNCVHQFDLLKVDRARDMATVRIEAKYENVAVYAAERSFEFNLSALSQDFLEVEPDFQGKGIGSALARNCHAVAKDLKLEKLMVTAVDTGSYVWARAGFLPTAGEWNSDKCLGQILKCLSGIEDLHWRSRELIYERLTGNDPEELWFVSDLTEIVTSPYPPHNRLTLGKVLLIESRASWRGELVFHSSDGQISPHLNRAKDYLKL